MSRLDIIVTHYDEPWDVCKPFFDMIQYQSCVEFEEVSVILVQDGAENTLPWKDLLKGYAFSIKLLTIPHSGTAAARNVGMKYAKAEWIMFCDIDDRFADVCSLSMILSQFPVHDYDVIWGTMITEEKWNGGHIFIQKNDNPNYYNTDCKFYRRQFLIDNNIRFDTRVPLWYDQMFNDLILETTEPFRMVKLTTDFYMYVKKHRTGSMRQTIPALQQMLASRFDRDKTLAQTYKERNMEFSYRKKIVQIICTEYFRVYDPVKESEPKPFDPSFLDFYRKHRNILKEMSPVELDVLKDISETEAMSFIQAVYNEHKIEYYLVNDSLSFDEWIRIVESALDTDTHATAAVPVTEPEPAQEQPDDNAPVVIPNEPYLLKNTQYTGAKQLKESPDNVLPQNPRVVVYCGTYNTYMNMLTSAKSLLWNTPVDKIYFLIEDNTFPYDLPDGNIIECINVKDQQWFPADGPNYDNSWSYMCMMRAAFTKLIPYDKVLSLDIDVVIQEDIGCLWDIDLSDYYLAGVAEPQRQKSTKDPLYINFGVVMMNLAKIRQDGIDDTIISALNRDRFGCPEQDAFNKFCAWHIYQLPNDYNATVHSHITGEYQKERIIHYAGIKFWRHFGAVKEHAIRPWNVVMERQRELR